jgi:sterol desaturase/sphingolipid hydroxylase (fatty acid hydroxylase superfamily)
MCKVPTASVSSDNITVTANVVLADGQQKVNDNKSQNETARTYQQQEVYSWTHPAADQKLQFQHHFSSLLFGGSVANTALELTLLAAPFIAIHMAEGTKGSVGVLNVQGSMPLSELAFFFVACSIIRRVYNAYLEAVYFTFPKLRTQPPNEHRLKMKKDLMGRDKEQLELLDWHDKGTMLSQFILNYALYFLIPGFYPAAVQEDHAQQSLQERFVRLILNHYLLSFGMYWAHRSLHDIPFLWKHIHSFHHYAKHPLSRNTYEDHWFDNFYNAIIGHLFAQVLIPLDRPTFYFSRFFRILESLEKHSGVSCGFNIAHSMQQWLPFAQMPHHHDWHHEGFKGSNYTFTSIGGLWDCLFGTRKGGRFRANNGYAATREDKAKNCNKFDMPSWFSSTYPLVVLHIIVAMKLKNDGVI